VSDSALPLRVVKVVHTIVWAFFASCVVGILVAAWRGHVGAATILTGLVAFEVVVLLANRWRCPLTDVASRYTSDRQDNFDIYLPMWLARYNKHIFGTLYVLGIVATFVRWMQSR
jgi:uncharacterized membrane protein